MLTPGQKLLNSVNKSTERWKRQGFQRRFSVTDLHGIGYNGVMTKDTPAQFYTSVSYDFDRFAHWWFKVIIRPFSVKTPLSQSTAVPDPIEDNTKPVVDNGNTEDNNTRTETVPYTPIPPKNENGKLFSGVITNVDNNLFNEDVNRRPIDRIVIHHNAGLSDEGARSTWYVATGVGTSAHYQVTPDKIWGCVSESNVAYHAGNYSMNQRSIGIEHLNNALAPNWTIAEATYVNSARLIADICNRYNIPCDRNHIIGHKEVPSATLCPAGIDINRLVNMAKQILAGTTRTITIGDGGKETIDEKPVVVPETKTVAPISYTYTDKFPDDIKISIDGIDFTPMFKAQYGGKWIDDYAIFPNDKPEEGYDVMLGAVGLTPDECKTIFRSGEHLVEITGSMEADVILRMYLKYNHLN